MSAFGVKVRELLAARGKDASWLHQQTSIAHSTISNWFSDPVVRPKPETVAKVAKALDVTVADLAPSAGYEIRASIDGDERAQRRADIVHARPRLGSVIDRLPNLTAEKEDMILTMIESLLLHPNQELH